MFLATETASRHSFLSPSQTYLLLPNGYELCNSLFAQIALIEHHFARKIQDQDRRII